MKTEISYYKDISGLTLRIQTIYKDGEVTVVSEIANALYRDSKGVIHALPFEISEKKDPREALFECD